MRKSSQMRRRLESTDFLDAAVIDVTVSGALACACRMREQFPETELLLIADQTISPARYLHPSIRASALLLRPSDGSWQATIQDFFRPLLEKKRSLGSDELLLAENRNGSFRIPFDSIYYAEAREKRVYICTKKEEIRIRETMERLSLRLPGNFLRCQRSYIVNMDYVTRAQLSENRLYLGETLWVPFSRSYRKQVKNYMI